MLPVIIKKTVVFPLFTPEFSEVIWELLLPSLLYWMLNTRKRQVGLRVWWCCWGCAATPSTQISPLCTFKLGLAALEHVALPSKKLNCAVSCTFEQLLEVKDREVEEEGLRREWESGEFVARNLYIWEEVHCRNIPKKALETQIPEV